MLRRRRPSGIGRLEQSRFLRALKEVELYDSAEVEDRWASPRGVSGNYWLDGVGLPVHWLFTGGGCSVAVHIKCALHYVGLETTSANSFRSELERTLICW